MKSKHPYTTTLGAICLVVSALAVMPSAASFAAPHTPPPSNGVLAGQHGNLTTLSILFSEIPFALSESSTAQGLVCGEDGHCNRISCDIECPDDQRKSCTCTPTSTVCKDKHDPYNPFDNDEHNMYQCQCECFKKEQTEPPPICVPGVVCIGDEIEVEDCSPSTRSTCLPEPEDCFGNSRTRMKCEAKD